MSGGVGNNSEETDDIIQYVILPYVTNIVSIYATLTIGLSLIAIVLISVLNLGFFSVATYTLITGSPPGNA